jgi:hypothetical protein
MRYHCTPVNTAKINNADHGVREVVEQLEHSQTTGENVNGIASLEN